MTDVTLSTDYELSTAQQSLGGSSTLNLTLSPDLHDLPSASLDQLVYVKASAGGGQPRILYKGRVRKFQTSLSSESVSATCRSMEQFIEGLGWTPTNRSYNDKEQYCGSRIIGATIDDVVAYEFDGNATGPQTWFTDVDTNGLGNKICAAFTTSQKSFLTVLETAISIYPNLRWVLEYDPTATTAFPIGKLTLIDLSVGGTPHTLQVGGAAPDVVDYSLTIDGDERPSEVRVYGYGTFTEREDVAVPAWDPADEEIEVTVVTDPLTYDSEEGHYVSYLGPSSQTITSQPTISSPNLPTMFAGKDFYYDPATGRVIWPMSDIWINSSTGALGYSSGGAPPSSGGPWRRLAARFLLEGGYILTETFTATYTFMGEDCYRLYELPYPVANVRLSPIRIPDPDTPGSWVDSVQAREPVVDAYKPDLFQVGNDSTTWVGHVADKCTPQIDRIIYPRADLNGKIVVDTTVKGYNTPAGGPEFREGTKCIRFTDRQLIMQRGMFWPESVTPPKTFLTWDIKVAYTAWEDLVEVRAVPGSANEAVLRFMLQSSYTYTQFDGTVIFDGTAALAAAADAALTYYQQVPWTGTINVSVERDLTALPGDDPDYRRFVVPFKVGDKISLAGEISAFMQSFSGIVNNLDFSNLPSGLLTIGVGRVEPRLNPFAPKPPDVVDIEAGASDNLDIYGLQRL